MLAKRTRRRRGRSRIAVAPILALAGVLCLAAAGCGSSSDTKANEDYANSVCSAIGSWETQIKSIASTFTGVPSQASLQAKLGQVETATKNLTKQIKSVPPPDSSEGQAAKQQLDQLTTDIDSTVNAAKSALSQIQANPSAAAISAAVATLAPQVQNLANETKSAVSTLKSAGSSLGSAFKNADSCKSLG